MKHIKSLIIGLLSMVVIALSYAYSQNKKGEKYMQLYEQRNHEGNDSLALKYLEDAAKLKDSEALARLGDAYLNGRYGLNNPEKALTLLQEAATAGSSRGMTNLGIMYLYGKGTTINYAKAFSWFEKAANAGDMKAPRYIGLIYEKGWGKDLDYKKAAEYYQEAADKGDITSQYYLGKLYEKGFGVEQDYKKAYSLYQQSAARGDIICLPAIMALGNMYEQGFGVDKSIDSALVWYAKGSKLGDVTAKAKIATYQYPENPYVMNVTAIVKVMGDGQKVAAIAIEYKDSIDATSLKINDFNVPDREITSVYVNNEAAISPTPKPGNFVIVELKTAIDKESAGMGGGPKQGERPSMQNQQNGEKKDSHPGFAGPTLGEISDKPATPTILNASIAQSGEIVTTNGQTIAASDNKVVSDQTLSPDIKDFKQLTFHDSKYNKDLMYNLYIPANYDSAKKYPLVLFMHDAGVVSNNHIETLTQGLGAVIWASKEDQQKHACFVLAPQYNAVMANDNAQTSDDMDITVDLLDSLMTKYSIDSNRLYNTGQSMGGMTSIAMDIKYPDLFAASMLVACQWDSNLVKPMAHKPLWIIVSQGDTKANPGMDAITSVLKKEGATVAKAVWNAEADKETIQQDVDEMLSQNASINYTVFEGGNHRYTWQYAYSIDGIRDWLFRQHK